MSGGPVRWLRADSPGREALVMAVALAVMVALPWFLPVIGGCISGQRDAYTYLPESIRKFPGAPELAGVIEAAGFHRVAFHRMTFGAVALHTGRKS